MLQKIILTSFLLLTFFLYKRPENKYLFKQDEEIFQEKITSIDQIIKENKGKVIYVDFWASWCAPCRKEIPKSLKLHKKYGDKVIFVYLSIEFEEDNWKNASNNESIVNEKYNLMTTGFKKSILLKDIKFSSIPHYLIFDKNGNLVNSDAPRPSDKKRLAELNKYILE